MLNVNNYSGSKHNNFPIKPLLRTARTGFSIICNYVIATTTKVKWERL
jgi:hypothetical protein